MYEQRCNVVKIIVILIVYLLTGTTTYAAAINRAIYGKDNRYETELYPNSVIREMAAAVAAQVDQKRLVREGDRYTFSVNSFGHEFQLCAGERFYDQPVLSRCSGFLIGNDLLVTAGHCVESSFDCANFNWVFDYKQGVNSFPLENVYRCKKIVTRGTRRGEDIVVIRLDRKVNNRHPLKLNFSTKRPRIGTPLALIGYPVGLPQKIAEGHLSAWSLKEISLGPVTFLQRTTYFSALIDSFSGNSGSPVINLYTDKVEGILVSGADDFIFDESAYCFHTARFKEHDKWNQERVVKIRILQKILKTAELEMESR